MIQNKQIEFSNTNIDNLALAALFYLILPTILFFVEYFRLAVGVPLAILTIVGLVYVFRLRSGGWRVASPGRLAMIVGVAVIWSLLGGAGHLFYANAYDWLVRDAVLHDLVVSTGLPSYDKIGEFTVALRAPIGYYMPAALLGKLFGIASADFILWLWTAVGVALSLALLPLPKRSPFRFTVGLLLVMVFSGMDIVGTVLTGKPLPFLDMHIEWWARFFQYSSNTTLLFWVPNHAIPGWIAAALFFRHWRNRYFLAFAPMMLAALPLWSPFALLGILPLMILPALLLIERGDWSQLRIPYLLPAAGILLIVVRYLTLDSQNIPAQWLSEEPTFFKYYVLFVLLEFALLAFFLWRIQPSLPLFVATVVLLLLPLGKFGPSNDLVMRASIPALTILCATALLCLDRPNVEDRRISAFTLILILSLGVVTAVHEIVRAMSYEPWPPNIKSNLCNATRGSLPPHYVARIDQSEFEWLLNERPANQFLKCARP